jgi:hypothetical protein
MLGAAAAACVAVGLWLRASSWVADPDVPLLLSDGHADWILAAEPFNPSARTERSQQVTFRKRFSVDDGARDGRKKTDLVLRAFKLAAVSVNGKLIHQPGVDLEVWKSPRNLDLTPFLGTGAQEIQIQVFNRDGPAALLVSSDSPELITGAGGWEASRNGGSWATARSAGEPRQAAIASQFPSTGTSLLTCLPLYLSVFLLTSLTALWWQRAAAGRHFSGRPPLTPQRVRWALIAAWGILAANNILKVPEYIGFDSLPHLDYIRYVAERGTIPLASEGWQMFQSPLYYMISAPLYNIFFAAFEPETATRLLRVVPLAAGIVQVQLSYMAVRCVFPKRADLQILGTLVGSLLPLSLYVSQGLGNEALAGCLCGAVIVSTLGLVATENPKPERTLLPLGFLLGLALLTKVTAVLLVPPVVASIAWRLWWCEGDAKTSLPRAAKGVSVVLATAFVVSGWYYARNYIALGTPFLGGWDPAREIVWWQDPGYRTLAQFTRFGEALAFPVYAPTVGFWDALYSSFWADSYLSSVIAFDSRPPWNYSLMISGVFLALLPSTAMLLGAFSTLTQSSASRRRALVLVTACTAIFLVAVLDLYVKLPIYTTGKATYTVGLVVCYAVLAATGLDFLTRRPIWRPLVYGGVAAWAVSAYGSYFVV